MKKAVGIVCEYNPFHNGHLYQINKIRKKYKDAVIIACLSGVFTQRGEISVLNKWDKTRLALENGVDIVVELPYVYATQGSDIFARYSVAILNKLFTDVLCFGSESEDIKNIKKAAYNQVHDINFDIITKKYLDEGVNYPTAFNKALKELYNITISEPNDILALSYLKEIYRNGYFMDTYNIKRTSSYHDLDSNAKVVSASNIRTRLLNKKDIKDKVPSNVYELLKDKNMDSKYFEYLKYKILSEEDLEKYVDVDEGLQQRIKKVINKSNSLDELIMNIKTKRYTYNKISRMLNHILCSFTKEDNKKVKYLEYIRILGFTENGKNYLNSIKSEIDIPVLNKYNTRYDALRLEKRAVDIYSYIYEDISKEEVQNKPIYIKENQE